MAIFFLLAPAAAANFWKMNKNAVCFDLEPWGWGGNQAIYEDSDCTFCVRTSNGAYGCETGIENTYWSDCIELNKDVHIWQDVYLTTHCDDALWIDRLMLQWKTNRWNDPFGRIWGADNEHGWCVSEDFYDYTGWNSDDYAQYVTEGECWKSWRFDRDGHAYAYRNNNYDVVRARGRRRAEAEDITEVLLLELEEEAADNNSTHWVKIGREVDAGGEDKTAVLAKLDPKEATLDRLMQAESDE